MSNQKDEKSNHMDTIPKKASGGLLYDPDKLNEIPILSVCALLSIPIEGNKQGHRVSCKVRQERTASTVLYLDTNTFYDYGGGGTGGDVIAFYAYATGVSQGAAMKALGQAFGIEPMDPRAGLNPNELTHREWKCIGLCGDRATKNFIFNVERMAPERLWAISEQYSMPMNALRKKHPHTYERILLQTALPYIRSLRNSYYLNVYGLYKFYEKTGRPDFFHLPVNQQDLIQEKESLIHAERILAKAIQGTSITFHPGKSYEVKDVLRLLLRGEPELGTRSYKGMQTLARKNGCFIRYRTLDLMEYQKADFSALPHTAFVKGDRVSVGFLPKDEEKITAIMEEIKRGSAPPLSAETKTLSKQTNHLEHDTDRAR